MIKPTTRIYRKQIIEGVSIPAIIHNGSYFFVDIDVYENGRIACWNFEDFDHFQQDVIRGWVCLAIPDNKEISIHGLGCWTIQNGSWIFNQKSFIDYVQSLIKELNPKLENLYKYSQKVINGVTIGESPSGRIYKELKKYPQDIFPEKIPGDATNLFYKIGDEFHLVKVNVFEDGTIQLSRLETPIELDFDAVEKLVKDNILLTQVPTNARVQIYGLGNFVVTNAQYTTRIEDKLIEIQDIYRALNDFPSTLDICREAYEDYLQNPTLELREKLRVSYQNVPTHQKRYVGDMDTKDIAVRMILFGEDEVENWSHYQVAKSMGEPLPIIQVPKPKDEGNQV